MIMLFNNKIRRFLSDKFFLILALFFIAMFILAQSFEKKWINNMLDRPKFTVGKATTDWHQKNNNGVGTDYRFKIKDQNTKEQLLILSKKEIHF